MPFLSNDLYGPLEDAMAVLINAEEAMAPALTLVSQHVDRGQLLSDEDMGHLSALLEDALIEVRSYLAELRATRRAMDGTGNGRKRGA